MKRAKYKYTVPQSLKRTENDIARFWNMVDRREPNECWTWQGGRLLPNSCGLVYGNFGVTLTDGRGYSYRAHRFAWMLANGELEHGLVVMHLCDTPLCVNPGHLKAGTQADNLHDRDGKGRQLRGVRHNMVKLTPEQVLEIRAAKPSLTHTALAKKYNVHPSTIGSIRNGTKWRHLE